MNRTGEIEISKREQAAMLIMAGFACKAGVLDAQRGDLNITSLELAKRAVSWTDALFSELRLAEQEQKAEALAAIMPAGEGEE